MVYRCRIRPLDRFLLIAPQQTEGSARNMSKTLLERIAVGTSVFVLVCAIWFWSGQINDVLETLKLAYG
jgi:hypothetical protein